MQSAMEVVDTKRGVKRMADESDLSDDQRFAKRFNRLNLDFHATRNGSAYVPVPAPQQRIDSETTSFDDGMQVDETKDRVYIGDLDAELADIEAHEPHERLIYLPDIEQHFSRIPHHLLIGNTAEPEHDPARQQLVLYDVPKLLTEEQGHASVRKAILEARRRAQDKAAEDARQDETRGATAGHEHAFDEVEGSHNQMSACESHEDPDAMDIS